MPRHSPLETIKPLFIAVTNHRSVTGALGPHQGTGHFNAKVHCYIKRLHVTEDQGSEESRIFLPGKFHLDGIQPPYLCVLQTNQRSGSLLISRVRWSGSKNFSVLYLIAHSVVFCSNTDRIASQLSSSARPWPSATPTVESS